MANSYDYLPKQGNETKEAKIALINKKRYNFLNVAQIYDLEENVQNGNQLTTLN